MAKNYKGWVERFGHYIKYESVKYDYFLFIDSDIVISKGLIKVQLSI